MKLPPFSKTNISELTPPAPPLPNNAIKLTNCDFSANNIVVLPGMSELDAHTGNDCTISCWVKVTTYPSGLTVYPFAKADPVFDDNDYWYSLVSPNGANTEWNVSCTTTIPGNNMGYDQDISGNLTNWKNLVVTFNSSNVTSTVAGYVNGVAFASNSLNTQFISGASGNFIQIFGLGEEQAPGSDPCVAYLADFRIYNAVLSGADITALAAKTDVTTNLTHRYKFMDNGNDSVGTAHGTVGAGLSYAPGPPGLPP